MAAPPSNKSPIATRTGPNSRNSEVFNPVRRSFTGNPFAKPSIVANSRTLNPNSETATPRRSSMGRETVVTFSEDKENGKDSGWKQIRVKSPAGPKSPAAKNFMSPTISAASKINPSPKKKILAERNEPAWTSSVSISEPKRVSFAPVTATEEVGPTTPVVVSSMKPPKPLLGVEAIECTEGVCGNVSPDCCVNLDPSFKISPPATAVFSVSSEGQVIAPLDADPSAPPPYDPKTNYLSPRPQFLHYRPNPRVEYYMSKDGEGKRLEESFISESFSDSEESRSEYSPKEVEDVTSPAEEVIEEEIPVLKPMPTFMPKEEAVEVEECSKSGFSWRSKSTALVMVLAVALFAVLAADVNVEVWSASSVSFVSEFISNIRGSKNLGTLQYYNLTLMEDAPVNEYSVFEQCHKEMEEMGEFDVSGNVMGSVFDIEASEEKDVQEIGAAEFAEPIDLEVEVQHIEGLEENQPEIGADSMEEHVEQVESIEALEEEMRLPSIAEAEYAEPTVHEAQVPNIECLEEHQPEIEAGAVEEHVVQGIEQVENIEALEEEMRLPAIGATDNLVEVHADGEFVELVESSNMEEVLLENSYYEGGEVLQATQAITEENIVADHVHSEPESIASIKEEILSSEVLNLTAEGSDSMVSIVSVLGIASLVLTLVGFTTLIYKKKRENSPSIPANNAVQPLVTKKLAASPTFPISTKHTYCPSEMSSFQTSSVCCSKGVKASDEVESQEKRARKNNRRDSLASIDSSLGSPSYGSFTTYERIPVKKGYGEEEIVTPVRRSSRIIRKVTSP